MDTKETNVETTAGQEENWPTLPKPVRFQLDKLDKEKNGMRRFRTGLRAIGLLAEMEDL